MSDGQSKLHTEWSEHMKFNFDTIFHKNLENRTKNTKDMGKYIKNKKAICPFILKNRIYHDKNRKSNFDTVIQKKIKIEPKTPKIWGNM